MGTETAVARRGVMWRDAHGPPGDRPPLDERLSGWTVHKRRPSHLNASRTWDGREFHLKWFFHRRPFCLPAAREWENAHRVHGLGIPSVVSVGWGLHPRGSFFVMEGSPGRPVYQLPELPPVDSLCRKAAELGRRVAQLHDARLCHRDLYVDHVLIHDGSIRLIDVGRVMRFRRRRWIVKDLGGLLFSAWRENLPASASRAFLGSYLRHSRRFWNRRRLLHALQRKARRYWRHNDHRPDLGVAARHPRRRAGAGGRRGARR